MSYPYSSGYGVPPNSYGRPGYGNAPPPPPRHGLNNSPYGGSASPAGYGSGPPGSYPGYGTPGGGSYGSSAGYGAPPAGSGYGGGNVYSQAGYSRPRPPTTFIDPTVRQWFETVDRDRTGQIDAQELQMALVNGDYSNFDLDTVKMLIGIFDVDKTGTISIEEFAGVFKYINDWRNVFQHFDTDRSGSIEGHELANALAQFGYRLSPFTLRVLEDKYVHAGNPNINRSRYGTPTITGISFDRFVRCCVAVKTLSENFQRLDIHRTGYVNMDYELFLQSALSAP